ncbi:MAG: aminotransferase class IV [Chloroflexota bacterium]
MSIFYVNGAYYPEEDAKISVRDLSVLRGFGAFDYLRTYAQLPFRLEKNLARLRRSCEILELNFPWSDDELSEIVLETLKRNIALGDSEEYSIRLVVTGGISKSNITPDNEPSLIVLVQPFTPLPAEIYETGAKIITVDLSRLYPDAKSTLYTPAILGQRRAREQGAIEAIYKDDAGNILEATTSNIFAFFGNTLVTPPTGEQILPGITRMTTLELAQEHFDVQIRELPYEEFLQADEAFLTSSNKEVLPIVQIDEAMIGDGRVGEGTQQLISLFREITRKRATGVVV